MEDFITLLSTVLLLKNDSAVALADWKQESVARDVEQMCRKQ